MSGASGEIAFGPFRLTGRDGPLLRGDDPVPLQPRPLAVLRYLAERPGEVIGGDELLGNVWAGTYVSRAVLKVAVRAIREALGDSADAPAYVETVGRKGYRFVGGLSESERAATPETTERPAEPSGRAADPRDRQMVGRNRELADLRAWLERAVDGSRQIVFVTGEAGIGKTTLLERILGEIRERHGAWVAHGQCLEHFGEGESYLPILEAVGRLATEEASGTFRGILERQAPTWMTQLPGVATADDEPERADSSATPERMLREMTEALEEAANATPIVLALEDLHWCDHSTLDLISYLARRRTPTRLLVLATFRPTDVIVRGHPLHQLKQELQAGGQCAELPVELLGADEIGEYVAARLTSGVSTTLQHELTTLLHERTEGNPLFMVNVVDHLLDREILTSGTDGWQLAENVEDVTKGIPGGVQQLIERHIDGLPPERQQLLEVASVAGAEFVAASVAAGVDSDPEDVEDAFEVLASHGQFIAEAGLVDWPDGTLSGRYHFRHALYQSVLYRRMAEARRVRLHRAIAAREIAAWGDRAGEHAAELAMHFERGREPERALEYHELAGRNAQRRHATHEVVSHLRSAIKLLAGLPNMPERSQRELGLQATLAASLMAAETYSSPNVGIAYERALALARQIDANQEVATALRGLSSHHQVCGRLDVAVECGEEMLALVADTGDVVAQVQADYGHGTNLFHVGRLAEARAVLQRAVDRYDESQHREHILRYGGYDPYVGSALWLGWTLSILGLLDQGKEWSLKGIAMAKELGEPFSWAWANYAGSIAHQVRGEWDDAAVLTDRALELAQRHGFPQIEANAIMYGGWNRLMQGDVEEGTRMQQEGAARLAVFGARLVRPSHLMMTAVAQAVGGDTDAAIASIDEGIAEVEATGELVHAATLRIAKGRTLAARSGRKADRAAAAAALEEAIAIAREQEAATYELRAATALARLWHADGRTEEARTLLAPLVAGIVEGEALPDNRKARELLATLEGGGPAKPKKAPGRKSKK